MLTKQISVRLDPSTWKKVKELALERGLKPRQYMRAILTREALNDSLGMVSIPIPKESFEKNLK